MNIKIATSCCCGCSVDFGIRLLSLWHFVLSCTYLLSSFLFEEEGRNEETGGEDTGYISYILIIFCVDMLCVGFALASVSKGAVSHKNRTRYSTIACGLVLAQTFARVIEALVWFIEIISHDASSAVYFLIFEAGVSVGISLYFSYILYSHNKTLETPPLAIVEAASVRYRRSPNENLEFATQLSSVPDK